MFLSQPAADCGKGKVLGFAGLVTASMKTGKEGPLAFTEYTESRYSVPGDKPETENRGRLACKVVSLKNISSLQADRPYKGA